MPPPLLLLHLRRRLSSSSDVTLTEETNKLIKGEKRREKIEKSDDKRQNTREGCRKVDKNERQNGRKDREQRMKLKF